MIFKFSLEKILSLVKVKETMKKMELAAVAQRIRFLMNRKTTIENGMIKTLELTRGGECPEWYAFYTLKMELDVREVHRVEGHVAEENELLRKKKDELTIILLKRKSLESLREKRWKEFRTQQNRRNQKQLDEIFQLTK